MKKLKLKLEGKSMLTKDQMKNIHGGYGCRLGCYNSGGSTVYTCHTDVCWFSSDGNCMYCGQNFYPSCCDNTILV